LVLGRVFGGWYDGEEFRRVVDAMRAVRDHVLHGAWQALQDPLHLYSHLITTMIYALCDVVGFEAEANAAAHDEPLAEQAPAAARVTSAETDRFPGPEEEYMVTPFRGCDSRKERANIVFHYPSSRFGRNPDEVADNLQAACDVMADQYPPTAGLDYRQYFSGQGRLQIGYRRGGQHSGDGQPVDETTVVDPGYCHSEHRINIPWDYLEHGEGNHGFEVSFAFQPEYACGHELGHPFEELRLAGDKTNKEEWKEGLCDFGRVLLLQLWAARNPTFKLISDQYEHFISTVDPTGKADESNARRYHYAARLLLMWHRANGRNLCLSHLGDLFNGNMTAALGSWRAGAGPQGTNG
jgi:hypothetical protein